MQCPCKEYVTVTVKHLCQCSSSSSICARAPPSSSAPAASSVRAMKPSLPILLAAPAKRRLRSSTCHKLAARKRIKPTLARQNITRVRGGSRTATAVTARKAISIMPPAKRLTGTKLGAVLSQIAPAIGGPPNWPIDELPDGKGRYNVCDYPSALCARRTICMVAHVRRHQHAKDAGQAGVAKEVGDDHRLQ